ncbi:hypothetical protein N7454_007912 [Penicillium verhagenii]|nr:hypothetical protein N7454_007912 [Penicillium verhagenii]
MSLALEHIDACVPTSALKALSWGGRNFILQGQGPFVHLIEDESGDVVTRVKVFKRNHLHGFISLSEEQDETAQDHVRFIVWGGESVRVLDLRSTLNDGVVLSVSSPEFLAPDWIMSGCAAVKNLTDTAYLITANNSLLSLKLTQNIKSPGQIVIGIYQLATSVKSILCSAHLVALSPTHVLIASGTIFGEIIVWSCFIDGRDAAQTKGFGSIHHFFTGHDGTVFGVQISPVIPSMKDGKPGRVMASCSDDRTVRIWDISDCEHKSPLDPSAYSTDGFDLRSTGLGATYGTDSGTGSESCIAQEFGHSARIWSIRFRSNISPDSKKIGMVTRSEDAMCIAWDLMWDSPSPGVTSYKLHKDFSSHAHLGKHIWSMDLCRRGDDTVVYTGGADGALRSFKIDEVRRPPTIAMPLERLKSAKTSCVQYFAFLDEDCLIMCDKASKLQIGHVSPGPDAEIIWEALDNIEELGPISLISGIPEKGLALISDPRGKVRLYNHNLKSVSDLIELPGRPMEILIIRCNGETEGSRSTFSFVASYAKKEFTTLVTISEWTSDRPRVEAIPVTLPKLPYDVASASLLSNGEYLLLGSRLGGLSVHRVAGAELSTHSLFVDWRVHGHQGTNHIQTISSVKASDGSDLEYVLSCGRDGKYCVHEVKIGKERGDAITLTTVHRTESALGGNIEGAYFDHLTGDLMMYGFRSQDFVLRNETKQTDIASIGSGGSRRPWDFQPRIKGADRDLLVWREGASLASQRIRHDLNSLVRAGGHGREIKAMDGLRGINDMPPLFASGAEDTAIRISTILDSTNAGPWGSVQTLRVLSTHGSGVQEVSWSNCGKYLFSSAACEEFFVWGVRWVPSFGVATILAAVCPKDDPDSELRITSFDVVDIADEGEESGFLLCLTLSNSTIKIFHYSPHQNHSFTLLARGKYMTNCLTQCRFVVQDSSVKLMTAATDGYFTLWDLTDTLQPFYTIESSFLKVQGRLESSTISPGEITCEDRHQVHSNSIKAMELIPLSETTTMVLSGGDDNSLAISLLRSSPHPTTESDTTISTISIPDAHAASVTTIKVLSQTSSQVKNTGAGTDTVNIIVASSGNDHRVKIWSISASVSGSSSGSLEAHFLQDKYSPVADISSMCLVRGGVNSEDHVDTTLLVGGVGVELLKINKC